MSSYMLAAALRSAETRNAERLIAIVLADAADDAGHVHMDEGDLLARTNLSRSAALRALKRLNEAGIVEGRPGRAMTLHLAGRPMFDVETVAFEPPQDPGPETEIDRPAHTTAEPGAGGLIVEGTAGAPQRPERARVEVGAVSDHPDAELPVSGSHSASPGVSQIARDPAGPPDPVLRVVKAARIDAYPAEPFYWHRAGHRDDLVELCQRTGMGVDEIETFCERHAVKAGQIRRLTKLAEIIARKQRAPTG